MAENRTRPARGLIDTSVVIDLEDIDSDDLPVEVAISSLTLAELAAGPHATDDSEERARRQDRLQRTEAAFDPLPFDAEGARSYGRIYSAVLAARRTLRQPPFSCTVGDARAPHSPSRSAPGYRAYVLSQDLPGGVVHELPSEAVVKTREEEETAIRKPSRMHEHAPRLEANGRLLLSKLHFHDSFLDLHEALIANATARNAWNDITPLARNEFICWVEDAKQATTRARRIRRTQEELENGQRRPCCWPGSKHRDRTRR